MDVTTIIIISAIVFAIGLIIGWILWGRKHSPKDQTEITQSNNIEEQINNFPEGQENQNGLLSQAKSQLNENKKKLESLQEKTKKQEEEIEDLEDDLDSYRKKLLTKTNELETTLEERDNLSKERNNLNELLSQTKNQLDENKKELNLKAQSISFVQEVLSAQETSNENEKKLENNVDEIVRFIKDDVSDIIGGIYQCSDFPENDPIFGLSLERWAATAKKSWINNKTVVAFVGEFSAGKTSIVNRILSQGDPNIPLLPVSTKATTAIPTYISGAEAASFSFVTPNNAIKTISKETFSKVNKEILSQIKGVSSLIQYFVIKYKNPNLEKLSILDTPGFSSNDEEDAKRTIEVINESDALFWVFDVNTGTINRSSINLIKKNLTRPLYIVINKTDTKSKTEVKQVEKLIRKTMSQEGINVQDIIYFSSKAPLKNIMDPILSIKHDSTKESYPHTLISTIDSLLSEQQDIVRNIYNTVKNKKNETDELIDSYYSLLTRLCGNCETASDIPHWETHLFSKDRYEMSETEYEQLTQELNGIIDLSKRLTNNYHKQMDETAQHVNALQEYAEENLRLQEMKKCSEALRKKIKFICPNAC